MPTLRMELVDHLRDPEELDLKRLALASPSCPPDHDSDRGGVVLLDGNWPGLGMTHLLCPRSQMMSTAAW